MRDARSPPRPHHSIFPLSARSPAAAREDEVPREARASQNRSSEHATEQAVILHPASLPPCATPSASRSSFSYVRFCTVVGFAGVAAFCPPPPSMSSFPNAVTWRKIEASFLKFAIYAPRRPPGRRRCRCCASCQISGMKRWRADSMQGWHEFSRSVIRERYHARQHVAAIPARQRHSEQRGLPPRYKQIARLRR